MLQLVKYNYKEYLEWQKINTVKEIQKRIDELYGNMDDFDYY